MTIIKYNCNHLCYVIRKQYFNIFNKYIFNYEHTNIYHIYIKQTYIIYIINIFLSDNLRDRNTKIILILWFRKN